MKLISSFVITLIVVNLVIAATVTAAESLYCRYPALSPDGKTVAFTYQGDIWAVPVAGGDARRVTVHEAEDIRPQFSPDGRWLLFSSQRHNNFDVFVIPTTGGEARQLTSHTSDDLGTGWFAGGDSIVFYSERDGKGDIFKVSARGGAPIKLTGGYTERENDGRISADGRSLVFTTGSGFVRWWRRDLKTSGNSDIYVQDRTSREFSSFRLTSDPTHELWPVLDAVREVVYFVANYDDGWAQVQRVSLIGGEPEKLTNFTDDGVQWLNGTPDGSLLVFEQNFRLWTLNPLTGETKQIPIAISSDAATNLSERVTFDGKVEWLALSPDGKKLAYIVHGEIFVMPTEDPEGSRQISRSPAREQHVTWGKDSRTLYYCSDRDGEYQIYEADALTGVEKRLTQSNEPELKPVASPDGKYLALYRGLDKIVRLELATKRETTWVQGTFYDLGIEPTMEYDWSPDSRWLAFTMNGPTYESDIWAVSLSNEKHNLSRAAGYNMRPRFTADGKSVYYTAIGEGNEQTYKVDLQPPPFTFDESVFDSLFLGKAGKDSAKTVKDTAKTVRIDPERIESRRRKAFALSGSSTWPVQSPDGKKFFFVASLLGKSEIWSVNSEDDPELKQLTTSGKAKSHLNVSADGKKLYCLEDGKIRSLSTSDGKSESLPVEATLDVDRLATYRQKFHEGWRLLNHYFYDPTFRGIDWQAVRLKYEAPLAHVRTDEDFRNVMLELMGELRGSHLDLILKDEKPAETIRSGELGIEFDPTVLDRDGLWLIRYVYPLSPAAKAGVVAGQYIVACDDVSLTREASLEEILSGKIDKRVRLSVTDTPAAKSHVVEVKPISTTALESLRYNDWVETRRALVDSLSGGRIAYLNIRAMNQPSLDLFKEQLVSLAEGKDGLLVDVRDNSGGWISVHLLGMLDRTPFILRRFRDFGITSENKLRFKASERPMALLIDNYSASNSEIFAEGFRRLKLGPIIGTPTASGVIGTSQYNLIDGTQIRRPSMGAFTVEMEDTDRVPRKPDVFVENLPDDLIAGRDPQLVRAVQELMKSLK